MKTLHIILKAHSLPVLCILAGRAGLWVLPAWLPVPTDCFHPGMSQAVQALSPFESEHKMLSAALLSSFFAHYSPLLALQPLASLSGHPSECLSSFRSSETCGCE